MKKQYMRVTSAQFGIRVICVILGICVGLIGIELILWVSGAYYARDKHSFTKVAQEDEKRIRIVALGESTTAQFAGPAWPEFLEQDLNTRVGKKMFRVYNLGVANSNSSAIYRRLITEAISLRPQIVITMMGVNDIKYLALPVASPTWSSVITSRIQNLRVYKLFAILFRLIHGSQKRDLVHQALSCHGDEMGDAYWTQDALPAYEATIRSIYPDTYVGQFSNGKQDQAAARILVQFLGKYPLSYQGYEVILDHFASRSMWQNVTEWTSAYKDMQPLMHACASVNTSMSANARDIMTRHIEDIGIFVDSLAVVARKLSTEKSTRNQAFYDQIKTEIGAQGKTSNFNTADIYRKIDLYLQRQKIHYVAMQYPLLSVRTLQDMFDFNAHVTTVGNEQNFQQALTSHPYSDLFVDSFAGIFGHTTSLGSQMIASSAADKVMEILVSTQ